MRKVVPLLIGVAGLVGIIAAADKPSEEHVTAMKNLASFVEAMSKPDAELDFDATKPWVPVVRDAFGVVEKYWTDRNTEGKYFAEITIAQEGTKAASDMGVAAALKSPEGIAASVKDIAGRCQGCHDAHREKAPDGSFLIK